MSEFYSPTLATLSLAIIVGVCGAFFGDFCSKLIYRLENNRFERFAVLRPSICPSCGTKLKMMDKLPFISYYNLKGHCRRCKQPIAKRYLILEFIGLILPFFLLWFDNFTLKSILDYFLIMIVICQGYIYYDTQDFSSQLSLTILILSIVNLFLNRGTLNSFLISFASAFILIFIISKLLKEKNSNSYYLFFTCYSCYFSWQNSIITIILFLLFFLIYKCLLFFKPLERNYTGLLLIFSMLVEFVFQNYLVDIATGVFEFIIN